MDYLLALELQNRLLPFTVLSLILWAVLYVVLHILNDSSHGIGILVGSSVGACVLSGIITASVYLDSPASVAELNEFIADNDCRRQATDQLLSESVVIRRIDLEDIESGCVKQRDVSQIVMEQRKALDQGDPDAH